MSWIVGVVAIAFAFYLWFLRKLNRSEIIVRVEPSSTYTEPSLASSESLDEEKDNWERFDFYAAKMVPAIGKFRINYVDQRGMKTERDIQVKRVHDLAGQYAIDAHCLLRNGHRSFINERISRAVNLKRAKLSKALRATLLRSMETQERLAPCRPLIAIGWESPYLFLYVVPMGKCVRRNV
jgi:hypothetical protein